MRETISMVDVKRVLATVAAFISGITAAAAAGPAEGYWLNGDQDAAVLFTPCGDALCGSIVWLKEPLNEAGAPLVDKNNPDPALQKRPICGLPIAGGLKPVGGTKLDGGAIYDPEDGKTYSAAIDVLSDTSLKITGYIGIKMLGRSEVWTRVQSVPPECGAPQR